MGRRHLVFFRHWRILYRHSYKSRNVCQNCDPRRPDKVCQEDDHLKEGSDPNDITRFIICFNSYLRFSMNWRENISIGRALAAWGLGSQAVRLSCQFTFRLMTCCFYLCQSCLIRVNLGARISFYTAMSLWSSRIKERERARERARERSGEMV